MKSETVRRLLKALIALLGAGVGAALTLGGVQLYTLTTPGAPIPLKWLIAAYVGTSSIGGLIFFLLSGRIIDTCTAWSNALEKHLDRMSMPQILSATTGLICGMLIAALVSQILTFMGASMFTTVFSAILYVLLGATGLTIGRRRSDDFSSLMDHLPSMRGHHFRAKNAPRHPAAGTIKLLDTSALIDGRLLEVYKTGFVEGEIVVPAFVLSELRHIADSADTLRRARGRHGLDMLEKMQAEMKAAPRIDETDYDDTDEVDVKLLRLAQEMGAAIVTGDYNLCKVAAVTGIRTLNLNALAGALRPTVLAGEEMTVQIVKEGKEPGQGVAYLADGTMIVIENGRRHMNESVAIVVTTALQTSAGRMIFARLKGE